MANRILPVRESINPLTLGQFKASPAGLANHAIRVSLKKIDMGLSHHQAIGIYDRTMRSGARQGVNTDPAPKPIPPDYIGLISIQELSVRQTNRQGEL